MIEATASKSFAEGTGSDGAPFRARDEESGSWLNLLCLDAPLVTISWHLLFARSFGIRVAYVATAALFLTSWLIYLADRFADSLSLDQHGPTSLRQRFCLRHRGRWLLAIAVLALADLVTCAGLEFRTLAAGLLVGGCAFVYLIVNQTLPFIWRTLPLKEIAIGFLFAAGTLVPLAHGLTSAMLPGWLLFASVCSLNCICIAVWERELDQAQERVSIATVLHATERALPPTLLLLAAVSLALAAFTDDSRGLYLCTVSSAVLLAGVHFWRRNIPCDTRTALADLVLLTPIIALLLL